MRHYAPSPRLRLSGGNTGKFDDDLGPEPEFPPEAVPKKPNGEGSHLVNSAPPLSWPDLAGREPPARRWAVKGWLGFGHTTLLVGAGGIGKTLIAQQLASSLALGEPFIGEIDEPRRVLFWACEDDHDELWRRQVAIARWRDSTLDAFTENLIIQPRHGLENALVVSEYGRPLYTPLVATLKEQAADTKAEIVILDNAAQLYGGGENDRHAVTAFLNTLAGVLPGRAVLLLAHPARSTGSEFSGSSAWENVARTRLYLGAKLPDDKLAPTDESDVDADVRYLARRKANYSSRDWRKFTYADGVLVPDAVEAAAAPSGVVAYARDQQADRIVLDALETLTAKGIDVAESTASPAYLPKQIIAHKLGQGRTVSELGAAMRRLRMDDRLERVVIGKYSNRAPKYGLQVKSPG